MAAAAAMSSVNLPDLPADVLYEIVWYLGYKDQVNLASTHPNLRFLRPREQTIDLNNLLPGDHWRVQWATAPILARGLIAVKMSYYFGGLWLRLVRDGWAIEESSHEPRQRGRGWTWTGTYGRSTKKTIEVANHPVGTRAKKGDTLRVGRTVPGHWPPFTVTLFYKR